MRRIFIALGLLCLWAVAPAPAADFDLLSADSSIVIDCQLYDSVGQAPVSAAAGDSVTVDVYYVNGGSMVGDSVQYSTGSAEVSIVNGLLVFDETFGDIDGAGGDGIYLVSARFTDLSLGLHQTKQIIVTVGSYATVADIAAEVTDSAWDELQTGHTTAGTFGYYLDAQVSGAGGGNWSTAQRDSVLNALTDAAMHYKIWLDAAARALTIIDEDNTTMDLNGTTVGGLNGITFPSNFSALAILATGEVGIDADNVSGNFGASQFESGALNGKGDWTTDSDLSQLDSILAMATRAAIALYNPCDTSFVREYPFGSKPKDSICVYCVANAGADTTKVATFFSHIYNKSTSTTSVIDSLSSEKK